eukprot:7755970-Pyramimonas_sp.AAC.1
MTTTGEGEGTMMRMRTTTPTLANGPRPARGPTRTPREIRRFRASTMPTVAWRGAPSSRLSPCSTA